MVTIRVAQPLVSTNRVSYKQLRDSGVFDAYAATDVYEEFGPEWTYTSSGEMNRPPTGRATLSPTAGSERWSVVAVGRRFGTLTVPDSLPRSAILRKLRNSPCQSSAGLFHSLERHGSALAAISDAQGAAVIRAARQIT